MLASTILYISYHPGRESSLPGQLRFILLHQLGMAIELRQDLLGKS